MLIDLGLRIPLSINLQRLVSGWFTFLPLNFSWWELDKYIPQNILLLLLLISFELMWILIKSEYGIKLYLHSRTRGAILNKLHWLLVSALCMGNLHGLMELSVLLCVFLENSIHAISHFTDNTI